MENEFIKSTEIELNKQPKTPIRPVLKARIELPIWKNKTREGKEYFTLQIPQGVLLTGRVNLFKVE